jgi:gliding motility-associated-like protein
MTNGTGLLGDASSTQSAIIVKQPGSSSLYWIFTVALPGGAAGYSYSIVDMTMSGGLGAVTATKNVLIYSPSTEKICAIRHCNNVDVWIVTHFFGTDEYRSFLLTSAGLGPAVSSIAGSAITSGSQAIGYLHSSPLGDKLCCVQRYTPGGSASSIVELLDFNNSTGIVSNSQSLGGGFSHAYGCEFSPTGRFLYVNFDYSIFQYDLCAGNMAAIVASQNICGTSASMWVGALQTGPDGKIYMAAFFSNFIGVINNPDVAGTGCNYVDNQIPLTPNSSEAGLPSFVGYYQPPVPTVINAIMSCSTGNFSFTTPTVSCSGAGSPLSTTWNFGDPGSGASNTSTISAPSHVFSALGTYTVQLIVNFGCFIDTVTTSVTVNTAMTITVNSPTICLGQTATLTAVGGATSYTWSAGATSTGVNTATATPIATTSYTVTGTATGCTGTAVATVTVGASLPITVTNDSICPGQTATLTASGGTTYSWTAGATSSGVNTATASPLATTTYTVTGTTAGCSGTAVATVTINPLPVVTVNSPTTCSGVATTLTAAGAATYTWSAGAASTGVNTATASPVTTTSYTVTGFNGGCSSTAVATVTVVASIAVNVTSDTVCIGQAATLTASGGTSYVWSAGATSTGVNTATASPAATTTYTVTGTTAGCSGTAVATVTVNPAVTVTVNSATVCGGVPTTLTANGATTYTWSAGATSTGVNTATVSPMTTTTYTVTGTSLGCSNTAVSTVTISGTIVVSAIGDTICSGNVATLTASGGTTYTWSGGATSAGANTANVSPASTSTYTVTGTTAGCTGTATAQVVVYPTPIANFTAPFVTSEINPQVQFTNHSVNALLYNWTFGDASSTDNTTTVTNPSHTYSAPGFYCVNLIATNNTCRDSTQLCIQIIPEFTFYIPNSFTPNNDGTNDEFYGAGTNIATYEMSIYNRWGELLFFTDDIHKHWDGKVKGGSTIAQKDVYVCVFVVTDITGTEHKYIGNVTLVQ